MKMPEVIIHNSEGMINYSKVSHKQFFGKKVFKYLDYVTVFVNLPSNLLSYFHGALGIVFRMHNLDSYQNFKFVCASVLMSDFCANACSQTVNIFFLLSMSILSKSLLFI